MAGLEVSICTEAAQAVMAVLYRHRKNRCEFGADLIESRAGELQSWLNVKVRSGLSKGRDANLSVKGSFQEKCQAIGLNVDYCTKLIPSGNNDLIFLPRIGVVHNKTPVHYFQLPQEVSASRKSSDEAFTKTLIRALDFGCGIEIADGNLEDKIVVEGRKVFLEHLLQIIEKNVLSPRHQLLLNKSEQRKPLVQTVLRLGALGTRLLISGRHGQFSTWVGESEILLGHSIEPSELIEFYRRCGRAADTFDSGLEYLKNYLPKALELLRFLDPENYQDEIKKTGFLEETNVIGKILRLKAAISRSRRLKKS